MRVWVYIQMPFVIALEYFGFLLFRCQPFVRMECELYLRMCRYCIGGYFCVFIHYFAVYFKLDRGYSGLCLLVILILLFFIKRMLRSFLEYFSGGKSSCRSRLWSGLLCNIKIFLDIANICGRANSNPHFSRLRYVTHSVTDHSTPECVLTFIDHDYHLSWNINQLCSLVVYILSDGPSPNPCPWVLIDQCLHRNLVSRLVDSSLCYVFHCSRSGFWEPKYWE